MTDEELQQTIQEIDKSLEELSRREEPLTKEEKRRQPVLEMKKATLQKIQEARRKHNLNQEMTHSANYALLDAHGHRHPFLLYLMQARMRWNIFY